MAKKDDDIKVTITSGGKSVETTTGILRKLANSPKLLEEMMKQAKREIDNGTNNSPQ